MTTKKNRKISVRLNDVEEKKIQKKAEIVGLSIGQYMRFISLNTDIKVNKIECPTNDWQSIFKGDS